MNRSWSHWMYRLFKNANAKKIHRASRPARLGIEHLEERAVPANFTLNTTANTLTISLEVDEVLTITDPSGGGGGTTQFTLSGGTFNQNGGDAPVSGAGTGTIVVNDSDLTTSLTINNSLATTTSTNGVIFSNAGAGPDTLASDTITVTLADNGTPTADNIQFAGLQLTNATGAAGSTGTVDIRTANGSISSTGATTPAAPDVTTRNLALSASSGIGTGNALLTSLGTSLLAGNLAAVNTGNTNGVNISNSKTSGDLNITTVNSLNGVTTAGGDISVTHTITGGVSTGNLNVNKAVLNTGGGNISLTGVDAAGTSVIDLHINSGSGGVSVTNGGGSVFLTSHDDVFIDAPVATESGGITVNGDFDNNAAGDIVTTAPGTLTTGTATIAGGAILIGGSGANVAQNVTLGGAVTVNGNGGANGITILGENNVNVNASVRVLGAGSTGGISVTADADNVGGGDIVSNASGAISTVGGSILIGGTAPAIAQNVTLGGTVTVNSGTGGITILGENNVNVNAAVSVVGAGTGNISITADADNSGATGGAVTTNGSGTLSTGTGTITVLGDGVTIGTGGNGTVTSTGGGDISLTSTGATNNVTVNAGVSTTGGTGDGDVLLRSDNNVSVNAPVTATGATGDITVNADFDNDGSGFLVTVNGGTAATNGTMTAGQSVTIVGRDADLGATVTAPLVTINPRAAAAPINFGTEGATAQDFGLSNTDLIHIVANTLRVGTTGAGGAGTISLTGTTPTALAGVTTLNLQTNDAIVDATGSEQPDITVANLALVAVNGIGGAGIADVDVAVTNLAVSNSTTNDVHVFNSAGIGNPTLNITTVDTGVFAVVGASNAGPGLLTINTFGGPMNVLQLVSTAGANGDILLTSGGTNAGITLSNNGRVSAAGANAKITLDTSSATGAGGAIVINATTNPITTLAQIEIQAAGVTGDILLKSHDAVTLNANAEVQSGNTVAGGNITLQANFGVAGGSADITLGAGADVLTLGNVSLDTAPSAGLTGTAQADIVMDPTATIMGTGMAPNNKVGMATLRADGNITVSTVLATTQASLTAANNIIDDSASTTTDATFIQAMTILLNAGGRIGGLNPIDPADVFTGNTATPNADYRGAIDIDITPGGTLTVTSGNSVAPGGTGGNVQLRQVNDPLATNSLNLSGATINAGNQLALISSGGNLTVPLAFTVPSNADALLATTGGNDIVITGSITNPGATATTTLVASDTGTGTADIIGPAPDTVADIVSTNLNLVTTGGTIGATGPASLEINATRLDGDTTGGGLTPAGGNVSLIDTLNGVAIGRFTTGTTGNFTLNSRGNIPGGSSIVAVNPNDNVAEVAGNIVTLNATGPGTGTTGQIGETGGQFFEVDANTLNATTNGSNVWISEVGTGSTAGAAIGNINIGTTVGTTAFLRVRNGGTLTSATVDGTPDVLAPTLNLSNADPAAMTGNSGSFGTSTANPLEIDVGTLNANLTGTSGNIFVKDTAGPLTVQNAATTSGNVGIDAAAAMVLGNGSTTGSAVVSAGGALSTATLTAAGNITDGTSGAFTDVVAATLSLNNASGTNKIGTDAVNRLTTQVGTLDAATGSGGVFIANTGALALNNVSATGAGNVAIKLADTAASGENLTVNAAKSVTTGTGNIDLSAGDNLTVNGSVTTSGAGVITLTGDNGAADTTGATITIGSNSAVTAATPVSLVGNTNSDTFNIIPQTGGTQFSITGNNPTTVPGDTLAVTGDLGTALTLTGVGSGNLAFSNGGTATFTGIETFDTATPYALNLNLATLGFGDGSPNADAVNVSTTAGVNPTLNVTVQNNSTGTPTSIFSGPASDVMSITIDGSSDSETFTIDETNPGIPTGTFNGNANTSGPGDMLVVNTTNATNVVFTPGGPGAGMFTFGNRNNVAFTGIETVSTNVVTIAATDPTASERGADQTQDPGVFTLTRTGDATNALTVNYTITGTAKNGVDYQTISGQATFAAGSATATVTINVLNNSLIDGTRTVTLTLQPGAGYSFAAGASATVTIADNDSVNRRFAVSTAVGNQAIATNPATGVATPIAFPFGASVNVAVGDVNGDGIADIALVGGIGSPSILEVIDGATGAVRLVVPLAGGAYRGGLSIAIGDTNGDGRGEIVLGLLSGVPGVAVLDGLTGTVQKTFSAFPGFITGVNVAVADLNGDGKAEIITAPTGVAPLVNIFDGNGNLVGGFLAFSPALGNVGLTISAGDIDGDGKAEIIAGVHLAPPASPLTGDFVLTYSATGSLRSVIPVPALQTSISKFGPPVATADVNGDGAADILVSVGPFLGILNGKTLGLLSASIPFPGNNGGLYVG